MSDSWNWNVAKDRHDRHDRHRKQPPFQGIQEKARLLEEGMYKDKQTFQFLNKTSLRHLPAATLRDDYALVIQGLDLKTGKPVMHGNRFIEPIHPAEIRAWLDKYSPLEYLVDSIRKWELSGFNKDWDKSAFDEAEKFWHKIYLSLEYDFHWDVGNVREQETLWRMAKIGSKGLDRKHWPNCHWAVDHMYQLADPSQRDGDSHSELTQNEHHPHVQCVLFDNVPLADSNSVSVPELTTILTVAGKVAMIPQFKNVYTIPVTVFSFSHWKVRIVQGCVNFRTRKHDIRCSDIIDLTSGVCHTEENAFKFCALLGWIVGRPVGDVMQT